VLAHRWQTIPERGVVRSRKPFKFWCAPTISLDGSGAVNCGGRQCGKLVTVVRRSPVYHTDHLHRCKTRWARGTASRGSVSGSADQFIQMCSCWQCFNWDSASRGTSVVAELLVCTRSATHPWTVLASRHHLLMHCVNLVRIDAVVSTIMQVLIFLRVWLDNS